MSSVSVSTRRGGGVSNKGLIKVGGGGRGGRGGRGSWGVGGVGGVGRGVSQLSGYRIQWFHKCILWAQWLLSLHCSQCLTIKFK